MRGVVATSLGHRTPTQRSDERHERRVEDGNKHDQDGSRDGREQTTRSTVVALGRQNRKGVTEKERSRVAHENGSGLPVEDQKAEQRAGKRTRARRLRKLVLEEKENGLERRTNARDPTRQAVHIVQ